ELVSVILGSFVELVSVLFVSFVELTTVILDSFVELVSVLFVSFVELTTVMLDSFVELVSVLFVCNVVPIANTWFIDIIDDTNKIEIKPNVSKFFPVLFRVATTDNPCAHIASVESCHFIHENNY
ncbi:MAG: hypothetical protein WCC52_08450, partial [Nitrosotalea sp.]